MEVNLPYLVAPISVVINIIIAIITTNTLCLALCLASQFNNVAWRAFHIHLPQCRHI